ncbi:DIA4 (YHR011W) [Zygosaccharomyces parabailii]|nr:DIA4 (YHR011W) [Zygosaccharomyces parabailii]CDH12609.1 probable Serine--tRNA ligase, mitochondrial [Zygosaccharomyces bailii ISA1307]
MFKRCLSTTAPCAYLKRPQFDVKHVIRDINQYEASIQARDIVGGSELLKQLQCIPQDYEDANCLDKLIAQLQKKRKSLEGALKADKSLAKQLGSELRNCKLEFQKLNQELDQKRGKIQDTLQCLPNLIHSSVPEVHPEIVHWINLSQSYQQDRSRDHVDVMTRKQMVDFQTAANVTGNSWYYLLNAGAQLEYALTTFAVLKAQEAGFSFCIPPSIARNEIIDACGFRPRDMNNEQQIYHLADTQLGLTATAEIALAGLEANKVMDLSQGPRKLVGLSRSYRAEAGARGKDTKGLYRVHEFTKVELFCWTKPEDSHKMLEEIKGLQIEIVDSLGLSAKVLNMPANDLGAPAYKKYDIEAWMPGRGSFGEISSTSNCLDFQSRRMNTKFKNAVTGKHEYVHTLNGTAMAVPRVILALIENFYDPTKNIIAIPECLRKFMGGREYIE